MNFPPISKRQITKRAYVKAGVPRLNWLWKPKSMWHSWKFGGGLYAHAGRGISATCKSVLFGPGAGRLWDGTQITCL